MDKKLSRMLSSSSIFSFVLLVIFAGITALFLKSYYVAIGEGIAVVAMFIFYMIRNKKRAKEIRKYVEDLAFQIDDATKLSITNFSIPFIPSANATILCLVPPKHSLPPPFAA